MIRLRLSGKGESRVVEFTDRVVTVGRGAESTLQVHDEGASRKHCAIEQLADGSYRLTDLASRNGTRLNGERVTESALKAGDVILIGSTKLIVEGFGADGAPPQPAPPAAAPSAKPEQAPHPEQGSPAPTSSQGTIKLVFIAGPNKGQAVELSKPVTTLGRRRRDNDIALFDKGISNRHAEIRHSPEGFLLADLGSKNGTFLNAHRIQQPTLIKPGDRIQLGHTVIEVRGLHATTATTAHIPRPSPEELKPPEAKPPAPEAPQAAAPQQPGPLAPQPAPEAAPHKAPSRWRVVALAVAIAVAVAFFAAVLIARALGPRRPPAAPTEKQPSEQPEPKKAATSLPTRPTTSSQPPAAPEKKERASVAEPADERRHRAALDAALRALRRAQLTGEPADFDTAQKTLEEALAFLKGSAHEAQAAKALASLPAAREAAAERHREAEAAALLAAAKRHRESNEPNIARLHCRELLLRFPNSQAAAEARALLAALGATATTPPEK